MLFVMNYSSICFTAIQAALSAGHCIRNSFESTFDVFLKEGKNNLVTEVDLAAEKIIIDRVRSRFPDHAILSEECGFIEGNSQPFLWIIDPLDGTFNFVHHVPLFSVSIAVAYQKEIIAAVIYQPMTNELFVAERGEGAYLNGRKLSVSKVQNFEEALCGTESVQLTKPIHANTVIRSLGSAALDLAYVAAGRFDGYWVPILQPWDIAAGKLLIEEAGGLLTLWDGSLYKDFVASGICASNKVLHDIILREILSE